MPMGFGNGPVHLNTALTSEFLDMPWVSIYLDDLIIASKTEEEHADHIKRVFQRLDDLNLSVALYKCQFGLPKLNYLGYTISEKGLSMNDNKLDLIQNMPIAKDRRGVRRILGVAGFYRRFVQHYSTITAPIADLLKEDQPFRW
eukprot:Nk52_evm1s997 gene=Nk52_evmTU1s997